MVTRNRPRAARRPIGESRVRPGGAYAYHHTRITSDRLVHLAERLIARIMFSAFFAAADTAWRKGRTRGISFTRHFAVVSFRLLAGFTLSARAETMQAAGWSRRTGAPDDGTLRRITLRISICDELYVDFVSIARRDPDVGQNGPVPRNGGSSHTGVCLCRDCRLAIRS